MSHLSKQEIKDLLLTLPDKFHNRQTTSHLFKEFLIENFYGSKGDVLEVGCAKGQTSLVLSHLFKKVFAMNIFPPSENFPTRDNIFYELMDSYKDTWKVSKWKRCELVLIDCVHHYTEVKQDTINALKLEPKYLIYDDYGGWPDVKKYVDFFIKKTKPKKVTKFGLPSTEQWIDLNDSEAILVEL
jgi:hypothetical protein